MAEHNDLGKLGEELAVEYLQEKGYEILKTNYFFFKSRNRYYSAKRKYSCNSRS